MRRRDFLKGLATLPTLRPASAGTAMFTPPSDPNMRVGSSLVLGGGGARGAYEAGVIEGLRLRAGIPDGTRIPGIDVVCGTSIGSINAWFVATGQYTKLRELWANVASEHVFALKRRFALTAKPGAFILNRIIEALALAQGLTKNVQGVLESKNVEAWLDRHIDPQVPVLIPFVFTATNLDRERAEVFYRLPFVPSHAAQAAAIARLRSTVGTSTTVRVATNDVVKPAMQASAAIPVLFDPVILPSKEPQPDRYIDGGVADNNPIDVARALSLAVYAVLVDPEHPARAPYANALEIGVGAFSIAENRVLEASLRSAYLETRGKRLFPETNLSAKQRAFNERIFDADLFTIRPGTALPVEVAEFDRQEKIDAAYALGMRDITQGWIEYSLPDLG